MMHEDHRWLYAIVEGISLSAVLYKDAFVSATFIAMLI